MKRIYALLLAALLTGCATMRGHEGTLADTASTVAALSQGAVEVGPTGLWGIPIRIAIVEHAKTLPREEAQPTLDAVRAVGWGAAANNLLVAFGAGSIAPLVGIVTGIYLWNEGEQEREFWRMCAIHKHLDAQVTTCTYAAPLT